MALTTQPIEKEERRQEIPEAQDKITGDLPPHLVEQIKTAMRQQLAQRFGMPEDTSFEDLRMEENRHNMARKYHLRNDATWGRIILSVFRRYKSVVFEFPKPGKTWKDGMSENLRQQRIRELGLPPHSTWEEIEIALAVYELRTKLGLPPNASLRNAAFTIKEI